ncbi:MAG: type VI secretion system protein TssA [Paracoccaceae bacterium]
MDYASLLESHGDDAPSGENLEYDPAFTDLELAAQPGEEHQVGDEVIPAEEPDFKEVAEKAVAVLERSHDLRAAAFLAQAQLHLEGLPGFAGVTNYIRRCLEEYWDTCHPQLDEDDDNDPTMRVNAVLTLADPGGVLRSLRLAPLTDSRTFGRFSLRDVAIANGDIAAPEGMSPVPDSASVSAAFQDTDPELLGEMLSAARSAAGDIDAIEAKFDEMVPGQGPDLDDLKKILRQAVKRLSEASGEDFEEAGDGAEAEDAGDAAAGGRVAVAGAVGRISGPNDVISALDRIIEYYARNEPSSPLPLLLERAKRLVNADFLSIVKDMAPSGVENVNLIGGLEDESY